MASFDDARLRKRVAWLNNAGGFDNQINYSKVAEAAEGLGDNKVMEVLKYLEDNYDKIRDPMRWILSSLEKAKQASEGLEPDFDQQLRRRVRWLNNEGGLENKLMYSKIAEAAAVGVDRREVMEVLRKLEDSWDSVEEPTSWVCAALRKAAGGGGGAAGEWSGGDGSGGGGDGGYRKGGGYDDFYDKLWRRINWLNTKGGFNNAIQYDSVAEALDGVDRSQVWDMLNYLEANWQKIGNPTSWVCSSLAKARRDRGNAGYNQNQGYGDWGDDHKDRELRRRIRAMNNEGGFENRIVYDKIAEASVGVELSYVLEVLRRLEDSWQTVEDPNGWVCNALRKYWTGGSGGGGGGGRWQQQEYLHDEAFDRKLRGRIRWLNTNAGFENRINYAKIAQVASRAPADKVLTALKYLEDKGPGEIEDPTSWVCAGITRKDWQYQP